MGPIRVIAIFDAKTGRIDGYRDFRQAMGALGLTRAELKKILDVGGAYHDEKYVSELIMHKSNRGGKR